MKSFFGCLFVCWAKTLHVAITVVLDGRKAGVGGAIGFLAPLQNRKNSGKTL